MILSCNDAIQFLTNLPSETIDLIIADPPYNIGVDGGKGWDSQWSSEEEYLDWSREWLNEAWRTLKPGHCMWVWGSTKTDAFLRLKLEVLNNLPDAIYQNWVIWAYDWGGRTKKTFPRKHEDILMFSKGPTFPFYPDSIRVPYKMNKNVKAGAMNHPGGKIPTDVWTQNNHTMSKEYVTWHPTQKPIALLSRIIAAHSLPGDQVLDPFSGSGSTAVAAINLNRQFIGCERDEEYYARSFGRIKLLTQ